MKKTNKLTDAKIRAFEGSGQLLDGEDLYILAKPPSKFWRLEYRFGGVKKTLALGVYPDVSLKEARSLHQDR